MRTYDLVYNSVAQRKIHSRVWKQPPEGLIRANIRKVTKDEETGFLTVLVVATVEDGFRTVQHREHDGADHTPTQVVNYKTITAEKVIRAKGVNKRKITLRLVDVD